MRKLHRLGAALGLGLGVALAAGTAGAAEHNWKMPTSWGGGPLQEIGAKAFAADVEKLTEGRIKIQVFPSGTLTKGLEVRSAVIKGVAEAGHTWMGYDWGKDKTTVVFGGFAGSMDTERMLHWLYEGGGLKMWRDYNEEKFGVVSFPCFARTAEAFLHSRKARAHTRRLEGPEIPHGGRLARNLEGPRRCAGDDAGCRSVHHPRAWRHRRHRVGHAL